MPDYYKCYHKYIFEYMWVYKEDFVKQTSENNDL
jgi:hypothetical protein